MASLDLEYLAELGAKHVGTVLTEKLKSKLKENLRRELKVYLAEGTKELERVLVRQFDVLALTASRGTGSAIKGKDPAAVQEYREEFIADIRKDLSQIIIQGDSVTINIGNHSNWGLDGSDSHPLYMLAYYIEGTAGEWGFITTEQYESRRGRVKSTLGRFGSGFMISKEQYEKEFWEKSTGVPFEAIRHSVSSFQPFRGFNKAAEEFDWSPYVTKAVEVSFRDALA